MKGRVVLLDQIAGKPAAALVVDGRIEDLAIDPADDAPLPGAIYGLWPIARSRGRRIVRETARRIGLLAPDRGDCPRAAV